MPRFTSWADPTPDDAARDVLTAYEAAVREGKAPAECYRTAVDAWVRVHPDQIRTYAARQALDIVLAARLHLRR